MLYNAITEAMRFIATKCKMRTQRTTKEKSYVGPAELLQLIDMDVRGTPNIVHAEGHHLAWVIGRICAVRTGALGQPVAPLRDEDRPCQYLAFKDIAIKRDAAPGEFTMELTIRNLKHKIFQIAEKSGQLNKTTKFYIKSPQKAANLALSAPHRFLVLALRRNALVGISTLDELLSGNQRNIRIKPEFMDKPVIVSATSRGLDVDLDKPASIKSISEYLRRRGFNLGYAKAITFYSLRRRAGSDITRVLGPDAARDIMCHDQDTKTLERFYLNLRPTTDVSAIGLGESHTARREEMMLDDVLSTLPPERIAQIYGAELNALVRKVLVDDKPWAAAKTQTERRNRERGIRRQALKELHARACQEQSDAMTNERSAMTKDVFVRRATEFNQRLLHAIRKGADQNASPDAVGDEFNEPFPEEDRRDEANDAEPDFEDQHGDCAEVHTLEEEIDYVSLLDDVPYPDAVAAAMQLMLENGLSEYAKLGAGECPLCIDDDTILEADGKYRNWSPDKLARHMRTQLHSKYDVFKRAARNKMADEGADGLVCEFCEPLVPNGESLYLFPNMAELGRHVTRSTNKTITMQGAWTTRELAQQHEKAKEEYGWYDPEFKGNTAEKRKHKELRDGLERHARARDHPSMAFTDEKALDGPLPLPGRYGVVRGSFDDHLQAAEERFGDLVSVGPIPDGRHLPRAIPPRFEGLVVKVPTGSTPLASQVPGRLSDMFQAVPNPGTPGNMLGGGKRLRDRHEQQTGQ